VDFWSQVFHWFTTSAQWHGAQGIPELFVRQLLLSLAVIVGAVLVGGAIGLALGHSGRGGIVAINAANAFRAVPTLALLTLLAIQPNISIKWGGFLASFIALWILAVPPILTNTFVGMGEVDPDIREAARAMGLTGRQSLQRVELPLAAPVIMSGIRTAAIEVVATSTLAAYVSYTDLGSYITAGLNTNNSVEAFSGALTVLVLAILVAVSLGAAQHALTPRGLRLQLADARSAARGRAVSLDKI
jgi:osmoprotectant transport system permease protein